MVKDKQITNIEDLVENPIDDDLAPISPELTPISPEAQNPDLQPPNKDELEALLGEGETYENAFFGRVDYVEDGTVHATMVDMKKNYVTAQLEAGLFSRKPKEEMYFLFTITQNRTGELGEESRWESPYRRTLSVYIQRPVKIVLTEAEAKNFMDSYHEFIRESDERRKKEREICLDDIEVIPWDNGFAEPQTAAKYYCLDLTATPNIADAIEWLNTHYWCEHDPEHPQDTFSRNSGASPSPRSCPIAVCEDGSLSKDQIRALDIKGFTIRHINGYKEAEDKKECLRSHLAECGPYFRR